MTTLYFDTENFLMEYVATSRGGLNGVDVTREKASIKKDASVYGIEDTINHFTQVYKPKEVIFCELK
jgi:hypothetical protein